MPEGGSDKIGARNMWPYAAGHRKLRAVVTDCYQEIILFTDYLKDHIAQNKCILIII